MQSHLRHGKLMPSILGMRSKVSGKFAILNLFKTLDLVPWTVQGENVLKMVK